MNRFKKSDILIFCLIAIQVIQIVAAVFFNLWLALAMLIIGVALITVLIIFREDLTYKLNNFLYSVDSKVADKEESILNSLKVPCLVTKKSGEIVWSNKSFDKYKAVSEDYHGSNVMDILGYDTVDYIAQTGKADIHLSGSYFKVRALRYGDDVVYYFLDETVSKKLALDYRLSRPVIAIVAIDSLDEVTRNLRDSDRLRINSKIQSTIELWFSESNGIMGSLSNDRYMLTFDEKSYEYFERNKFSILEKIRKIDFGGSTPVTLSIGVGRGGKTLSECEEAAVQALDMALGRGGDQVAVKSPGSDYKFFGGVKAAAQTRTRVRTRIVASALTELIAGSDNVILMGHRYSDLDCLGAAFSLYRVIKTLGKNAYIALNRSESLAKPLLEYIGEREPNCQICDDEELLPMITKKTLLIVVDTHRPSFLDYESIYNACETVVVIDHHRKAIDHIENAVIFYHETAASSVCEMTSELIQYMGNGRIGPEEADALLSGVMLDTRSFVLHTGVRTFESAAYLRRQGADPVKVKKLFSGTMPAYRQRVEIVGSAETYDDCAIAFNYTNDSETRIATAQAADELLNVGGIMASFVMCKAENKINISARSLGEINVQLVMEKLGGGGHRTMAAAQIEAESYDDAKAMLIKAIDEYKAER